MSTWRTRLVLVLFSIAISGLVGHSRNETAPRRAVRRLVLALGALPNGAVLAGSHPAKPQSHSRGGVEDWPPEALAAIASLNDGVSGRDGVRLQAAVDLFRGRPQAAAAKLEQALRGRRRDPFLLNDTSAAYLVLADAAPDAAALHLSRAFERASEAAELRPRWPEPRHNKRASLEALGIAAALDRAPVDEPGPRGPEDLRDIGAEACLEVTRKSAQAVRDLLETRLASAWAEQLMSGDPHSERYLASFECLAAARLKAHGDRMLLESATAIRRATEPDRRALAKAHLAYSRGRTLYDSGNREAAVAEFAVAREAMARHRSPFELEASLHHTIGIYQLRHVDAALSAARRLRELGIRRGYPALAARSAWILGLALMQRGRIEEAVRAYEEARRGYEQLAEPENAANVANSAADTLRISGDVTRGWPLLTLAARSFDSIESAQRRYLLLFNLSLYAQDEGLWRTAEEYQTAALAMADRRGQILTMIEARLRRAQLRLRRRSGSGAQADLHAARDLLPKVSSATSLSYLTGWHDRLQAQVVEQADPGAASLAFESLVPRFLSIEPAEVPSLYLQAGQAARAARDPQRAADLLRRGIAVATERRGLLTSDEYRITHFSTNWDLYHELIDLELERDPNAALAVADEGRATLASRPGTDSQAIDRSIVPPLADDEAVLYYAALRDRLIVWVIARGRVVSSSLAYAAETLAGNVTAFRDALAASDSRAASVLGRQLFNGVLAPALAAVPDAHRIFVAPDGPLGDLPFALLVDPASNRFVIERYEIAYVPVLAALQRGKSRSVASVLAVGYNGDRNDGGPRLESAEAEAEAVAKAYRRQEVLAGPRATADALGSLASTHDVIHIAAHAEANRLAPWLSHVRLAPAAAGESSGTLRFGQAAEWDLRRCVLVVLSACDTAAGSRIRAFGTVNLAGPFLSAGAAGVVGTLWRIDDRASSLFMPLFHRRMAAGIPPAAALREAQLEALRSPNPDLSAMTVWGAWVLHTRELPLPGS